MTTKFKCDKCGCEPDILNSFGAFGNNPLKISDNKEYCDTCFLEVEAKYNSKHPEVNKQAKEVSSTGT